MLSEEFKSDAELRMQNINWDRSLKKAAHWAGTEAVKARQRLKSQESIY